MENVRVNAGRSFDRLEQQPWTDRPLCIVAGGPSLADYMTILKSFLPDCDVLSVNGAYKHLSELGIESDHFVLIDSRPENVTHVERPLEKTRHYLASQVHPSVFSALAGHDVTMFHLGTEATIEALEGSETDFLAAPIGMASVHAIYIAAALGYRKQFLFGYDFSQKPGKTYAFDQPMNADDQSLTVTMNGKEYRTTMALARTAEQFVKAIYPLMQGCDLDIRMCSSGLLPDMLLESMKPHSEDTERIKYEQMWSQKVYHEKSPGLDWVYEAFERLEMSSGESLVDLGCGTGRCAKWFANHGMEVTGVDIADNALEEEIPFERVALWDQLPEADHGFCVDVMEHIPPEKVEAVLQRIYDAYGKCFFNIDTLPDAMGVLIGKSLHLTVRPAEWWQIQLRELWPNVQMRVDGKHALFVCTKET